MVIFSTQENLRQGQGMKQVVILGAGPAACLLALSLVRLGHSPVIIGQSRGLHAIEGLSQRVIDALGQLGCKNALSLLQSRWLRVSSWNGDEVEMNGEYVVNRVAFDNALMSDVRAAGVEVYQGKVRRMEQDTNGDWCISWEDQNRSPRYVRACLIGECRGYSAPKAAPDVHVSGTLVALSRIFIGARPQPSATFIESFPYGWAWGTVNVESKVHIQIVVLPEGIGEFSGDLDAVHSTYMKHLHRLQQRFGGELKSISPTCARGIRPTLRGAIANSNLLRVGDSAYTSDPLSGHGIFEASSGAIAAAPVINTLLHRPQQASVALRFMEERASMVYFSRLNAASQHYLGETRWADNIFWRHNSTANSSTLEKASRIPPAFVIRPVIENGFIVERRVVVSDEYPRGVRFIDGVDLGEFDKRLRSFRSTGLTELSRDLCVPVESVCRALRWLQVRRLLPLNTTVNDHTF